MHDALLTVHSLVRWIALVAAVAATLVVARDHGDRQRGGGVWGAVLTGALDLQLLVGIGLLLVNRHLVLLVGYIHRGFL